ncbi:MAG: hypothetical protein OXB99_02245 [Acidimicrobiaceae bacterium]|nr:hypothetical protein [Acidimicrobiaceae bacterium]
MTWRVADPQGCFDEWAGGKSDQVRERLLRGLADLADRPLDELPGFRLTARSPMNRWTIIGSTLVVIRTYETAGVLDLVDLREL